MLPVVALVALAIRLGPLLAGPGLLSWDRYDDGVYYTAAASLLDGRLPYRDFVLLHPPLIMLALTPFALLGRLTSDPTGLVTARIVWMLLGTGIAVLAARFAGRWGTLPALVAGLWVACSTASAYSSQTTYIEPVADLALLGAIVLLSCDRERPRHELIAGLLLGIALTGKIWYVVPVGTVLLVMLLHRRFRTVLRTGVAAAAVAAVILLPFFLSAPSQMWHMVVYDQISRPTVGQSTPLDRLGVAVGGRFLGLSPSLGNLIAAVATVIVLAGALACLRWERQARIIAAVAIANVALLVNTPTGFHYYGSLTSAPVGISLAVGWAVLGPRLVRPRPLRLAGAGVALAAIGTGGILVANRPMGPTFPTASLRAVLPPGCLTTDTPGILVVVNRLSSNLRAGCPVAVDVTGASRGTKERNRHDNLSYIHWLGSYLASGSAVIMQRPVADGFFGPELRQLGERIYNDGRITVIIPKHAEAGVRRVTPAD